MPSCGLKWASDLLALGWKSRAFSLGWPSCSMRGARSPGSRSYWFIHPLLRWHISPRHSRWSTNPYRLWRACEISVFCSRSLEIGKPIQENAWQDRTRPDVKVDELRVRSSIKSIPIDSKTARLLTCAHHDQLGHQKSDFERSSPFRTRPAQMRRGHEVESPTAPKHARGIAS
jgi:hypothetical protein